MLLLGIVVLSSSVTYQPHTRCGAFQLSVAAKTSYTKSAIFKPLVLELEFSIVLHQFEICDLVLWTFKLWVKRNKLEQINDSKELLRFIGTIVSTTSAGQQKYSVKISTPKTSSQYG